MTPEEHSPRRRSLWLGFTLAVLAAAIVFAFVDTTRVRWFVLLGSIANVLVAWELRKGKSPAIH